MVTGLELFKAIGRRASVRAFKGDPIREGDLEKILSAATLAPSAGNLQPWCFLVSTKKKTKEALAEAALGQSFMAEAPVIITVCAVEGESAVRYGNRGRELYCIQDTAAATENILLAATALGYGSCWIGAFDEDAVKKVQGIQSGIRPVALIPLGFPDESPQVVRRKPLGEVVRYESCAEDKRQ